MNQERLMQILVGSHVSEKSQMHSEFSSKHTKHTFKVLVDANKLEIKSAVEFMFSVKVKAVRVVRMTGKSKRFGHRVGRRADWKKAIIRLEDGHDIDLVGGVN